jgi:hypothetical protein
MELGSTWLLNECVAPFSPIEVRLPIDSGATIESGKLSAVFPLSPKVTHYVLGLVTSSVSSKSS